MLILAAIIEVKEGKKSDFIALAQKCITATRQEPGCVSYELYASTENSNKVMFYEEWADDAALAFHNSTPHLKEFGAGNKELVEKSSVTISYTK